MDLVKLKGSFASSKRLSIIYQDSIHPTSCTDFVLLGGPCVDFRPPCVSLYYNSFRHRYFVLSRYSHQIRYWPQ